MTQDEIDYYRNEWEIARDPTDRRHAYPPRIAGMTLDVGCGCGAPAAIVGENVVGAELNVDAMRLGRQWGAPHGFVAASGERLPFRGASFDRVVARVSLPYMHLGTALREIARVTRPGGELWVSLHSLGMAWRFLRASRGRAVFARIFVLLNGALLHATGRQLRLHGIAETYQTDRSIMRALAQSGFRDVRVRRDAHYIVTAVRSDLRPS